MLLMCVSKEKILIALAWKCLSVQAFCEQSKINRVTFDQILNGARRGRPETIGRIAAALNVDVLEILATKGEAEHGKND